MRSVHFDPDAGDDSSYWPAADREVACRIGDEHRLVYRTGDDQVKIVRARYHY